MKNIKGMTLFALVLMALVSFSNLVGLRIAGISVVIGVIFFFVTRSRDRQLLTEAGLDLKALKKNFRDRSLWFWIALPLIMDAISIAISKFFFPEFIEHLLARTEILVSFDILAVMVVQLAILALAEEIAWRAFFQNQVNKGFSVIPAILLTSVIFAFGHLAQGNIAVVMYDLFFVFINSAIYGIIFAKTNNAWASALAHFMANLASIIFLVFLS